MLQYVCIIVGIFIVKMMRYVLNLYCIQTPLSKIKPIELNQLFLNTYKKDWLLHFCCLNVQFLHRTSWFPVPISGKGLLNKEAKNFEIWVNLTSEISNQLKAFRKLAFCMCKGTLFQQKFAFRTLRSKSVFVIDLIS